MIPSVTFKTIDKEARTATFDVGGEEVTRHIPAQFVGTIDDYLAALESGLVVEFTTVEPKEIAEPSLKSGESFTQKSLDANV